MTGQEHETSIPPGEGASAARNGARPPLLEFRHITKAFPGQLAVDDVSFTLERGEIHALVGENGAGKTTLIKVLAGEHHSDAGEILLDGEPLLVRHPSESIQHGIGFIHQEPALVPDLSVAENLTLGLSFERRTLGLINWRAQRRLARKALAEVGLRVDPRMRLDNLTVADRQLVAIARILLLENRRIVVFDEATAPLTETEVERLFAIIRDLRENGAGIIYISHRLEEIFLLADRVTVMRNGAWVATHETASLDQRTLVRLIIGHDPPERPERITSAVERSQPVISVRDVSDDVLKNVSFDLYEGEILGLAGLVGAGRTNVLETIFGARKPYGGSILLDGKMFVLRHPADAVRHGIAMVTEDRKQSGFIGNFTIWQNITLPWVRKFTRAGLIRIRSERAAAREVAERFDVRARSIQTAMSELSGGNQQKTILARWLSQRVRVLLLDEPTHGVDVGAKEEIYRIIRQVASEGVAVLLVSSELEELELLCTRVLLLREGRVVGEASGREISKASMLADLYDHQLVGAELG